MLICATFSSPLARAAGAADPPITPQEATALAKKIQRSMSVGDPMVYNDLLDKDALVATAVGGLPVNSQVLVGLKSNFKLAEALAAGIKQGDSYRFLHLTNTDGVVHPLFRLLLKRGGVNYHEMTLGRSADGVVRIVDIYVFVQGELLSQTLHRPLVSIAASENRNVAGKLIGSDNDYVTHQNDVVKFAQQSRSGAWAPALATYGQLPESLQHEKTNMILHLIDAEKVDRTLYEKSIEDFEALYPQDPSLLLIEIDRWFLLREYDKELGYIDQLDKRVGGDPHLDYLRARARLAQGRTADAKMLLTSATQREPGLRRPWEALIDLSLHAKDNAETARLLDDSASAAGIQWTKVGSAKGFADFVNSPEGAEWVKTHPQIPPATTQPVQ